MLQLTVNMVFTAMRFCADDDTDYMAKEIFLLTINFSIKLDAKVVDLEYVWRG